MTIKSELGVRSDGNSEFFATAPDLYDGKEIVGALHQRGIAVLNRAGIPDILTELISETRTEVAQMSFVGGTSSTMRGETTLEELESDLYTLDDTGAVHIDVGFVRKSDSGDDRRYKIRVYAEPVTEALIVQGKRFKRIPKSEWSSKKWRSKNGRSVLEKAIVRAYRNPLRIPRPV